LQIDKLNIGLSKGHMQIGFHRKSPRISRQAAQIKNACHRQTQQIIMPLHTLRTHTHTYTEPYDHTNTRQEPPIHTHASRPQIIHINKKRTKN